VRRVIGIAVAAVLAVVLLGLGLLWLAGRGTFGSHDGPGEVTRAMRPAAQVASEQQAQTQAAGSLGIARPKQVLFGDLHVHTTISYDAFLFSLPLLRGEGAHPPADACDFARFCSALDFWSITDHDFAITPEAWRETIDSIRACNEVAGDGQSPDTVAFLGWEWTQVGSTPENHYGHKNVVLAHTDDARIPARPIGALRSGELAGDTNTLGLGYVALRGGGRMHDLARYMRERASVPVCDPTLPERELPADCYEQAATPEELFRRLDEWGNDALVIPHGTTWGFYTPPGSRWDKQLAGAMHDPARQTLFEIYSGHGDGEAFRDWQEVTFDADGKAQCPAPRPDYEPTCWRAGEIIRARCLAAREDEAECEKRAEEARFNAANAGVSAHRTVPGATGADFLDAGQCRDCRTPAFNYRPGGAAQYVLALGNFDDPAAPPRHFRFGFIGSSDNHYARPGTGYKQFSRKGMTESQGGGYDPDNPVARVLIPKPEESAARSRPFSIEQIGFQNFETERQASFLTTGGLVALHADGRDRDAIWQALQRREVYGTSGPRMLLWFDLLNAPGSGAAPVPMGGAVAMSDGPIFQVRAVGSFEQKPGCPDYATSSLSPERLRHLCKGECYHPSDQRRPITRIEVVRIRPQSRAGEPIASLIDDPWRRFDCAPDPAGCVATFTDPEFPTQERDTLYYARAFEPPKPVINGQNLRCERDAAGNCTKVNLCPGPQGDADNCLGEDEPRAWSSPIYVDFARP
jgi:hypothetical protein